MKRFPLAMALTKIFLIAGLMIFSKGDSFGQFGIGSSAVPEKIQENFEHIGCGFRYPFPGKFTLSTAVDYSPYRELGQGMINHFESNLVTYDIGCIDLDDPPRKMSKAQLISSLNSLTKAYLLTSAEFVSRPAAAAAGKREIYEFETQTGTPRRLKYILEGNRVLIFTAAADEARGMEEVLKLFNSVDFFSVRETAQKRMATAAGKYLPQSPALKPIQKDAARAHLKGLVKSVRLEAEDVPVLAGNQERRIEADDTYDRSGNLLKSFWFQDGGYPTSITAYGFVDGARVSDTEEIGNDTSFGITVAGQGNIKLPPPDPRYEDRYEYQYDAAKKLIEYKEYDNRGRFSGRHTFTYQNDRVEEKKFGADGKLYSTKRRQLDKNGNELKYEFWWYDDTDKEIESYDYKKFDRFGNWTQRRVVKTIIDQGLTRTRTSNEFRTIDYYDK